MNKIEFPDIEKNKCIDHNVLRWYAVCLTSNQKDGINLPLAKAITDFTLTGTWNTGTGYEKDMLDKMLGKPTDQVV